MENKLHRIPDQAVIGGVAAGIAQYLRIDVAIIRVIMVVMLLLPIPPSFGWTGLLYLILWAALPTGPAHDIPFDENNPDAGFQPFKNTPQSEKTIMILGGALILFGGAMLLDDFPIWYQIKKYIIPIGLMATGAFLILRQRDKQQAENNPIITPPPATEPETPEPTFASEEPVDNTTEAGNPDKNDDAGEDGNDDGIIKVN